MIILNAPHPDNCCFGIVEEIYLLKQFCLEELHMTLNRFREQDKEIRINHIN